MKLADPLRLLRSKFLKDTATLQVSAMLNQASRGHFPQPLVLLVQDIGNHRIGFAELDNQISHLVQLGGDSGCDMLAGVLGTVSAFLSHQEGVERCTKT